jgi:hypothetical protein
MDLLAYATQHLTVLKERYPEIHAVCPFCGNTEGKFQFNVEKGVGRCWRASCDRRLTLSALVAMAESLPTYQASQKARQMMGQAPAAALRPAPLQDMVGSLPEGSVPLDQEAQTRPFLSEDEIAVLDAGLAYLAWRGIDPAGAAAWNLAVGVSGDWRGRVLFPAVENGCIMSLSGRSIELVSSFRGQAVCMNATLPGVWGPKYMTPGPESGYMRKGEVLLNLDRARSSPNLVLVEDSFSAYHLTKAGLVAISPWGTALTAAQLSKLDAAWFHRDRLITILLDKGADGEARKMAEQLSRIAPVRVAVLTGSDPDEDLPGALAAIQAAVPWGFSSELDNLIDRPRRYGR